MSATHSPFKLAMIDYNSMRTMVTEIMPMKTKMNMRATKKKLRMTPRKLLS